jgi:hypothetical protein
MDHLIEERQMPPFQNISTFAVPLLNAMLRLSSHTFLLTGELYYLNNSKFISDVTSQGVKTWKLFYNRIHLHNFAVD